ncbi:hypothetical protein [Peribacillus sp. NPDC096540]|uniref:hypothetical protein n=1 Tax=Peribacillus sp. NPDC096540 TaxID=3390612 RepID=UPI003D01F95B
MTYIARTQRVLLGLLLATIVLPPIITHNFSIGLIPYFQFLLIIFIFVAIFIQFKFRIDKERLSYQILFLTMPIYKKVVYPKQIVQMKFKRVGWATKGVIIQVNKGLNIRIFGFAPDKVLIDLIMFANENDISIFKTKDYLVLEKTELRQHS